MLLISQGIDWFRTERESHLHTRLLVGGLEHCLFFHILGIIIPTDFHKFRGAQPATRLLFFHGACDRLWLSWWLCPLTLSSGHPATQLWTEFPNHLIVIDYFWLVSRRNASYVICLPSFLDMLQNLTCRSFLQWCTILCACLTNGHLNLQKRPENGVVYIFAPICASGHSDVHFFDISTCKTENGVFCTFWLRHVLGATTTCTFSIKCCGAVVFCTFWLGSVRHNGVQLFIYHLAAWLRTRRFSQPTFRPSGATSYWAKHNVSRLSYPLAHLHLLSSDFDLLSSPLLFWLSSLTLPISVFHLSIM